MSFYTHVFSAHFCLFFSVPFTFAVASCFEDVTYYSSEGASYSPENNRDEFTGTGLVILIVIDKIDKTAGLGDAVVDLGLWFL